MEPWRFVLTDLNFKPLGEITNAHERKVINPLSKLDGASFRVGLDHPLADPILSCESYLKAYRGDDLRFFGPVISAEEIGEPDKASIAVNCMNQAWMLTKRLSGKSAAGQTFSTSDRKTVAQTLIYLNDQENELHIEHDFVPSSNRYHFQLYQGPDPVTYTAGPFKPTMDCINELAQALDGFEYRFVPKENWVDGVKTGSDIVSFMAESSLGTWQPEAVFEWGHGRNNLETYKIMNSREGQAVNVFHLMLTDATYPWIGAQDPTARDKWGMMEDVAQADITDTIMRRMLVSLHIKVRKEPRRILTATPHITDYTGRTPQPGVDYDVGDAVNMRAKYQGQTRFNAAVRVWSILFDIDDAGGEKVTLTMEREAS